MARVAPGLSTRPAIVTSTVRHTPWSAALRFCAAGLAARPAASARTNIEPEIRTLERVVMEASLCESTVHLAHAPPQASTHAAGVVARNGAPSRYPSSTVTRLDSWKEIAGYLGRGVRTGQRWEREEGLPGHRNAHGDRGSG